MNGNLRLMVRNRQGIVLDEQILALSSGNKIGKFDVLLNHANFISIVNQTLVIKGVNGESRQLQIDNGILKVRENRVEVYIGVKK